MVNLYLQPNRLPDTVIRERSSDTLTFVCFCNKQGVLETLGNQLKQLDEEIKADEGGKQEFERRLTQVSGKMRRVRFVMK